MKDKERDTKVESYHLFIAIRRKKENRELKEICFRHIIRDDEMDLRLLKEKIKGIPGIWRIYKTVNARKVEPARKLLMKRLIDEHEKLEYRIDSLWKTCLLQPECKAERKFLIDVDAGDVPKELISLMYQKKIIMDEQIKTPNGYHLICKELDTRLLEGIKDVSFKRDAIKFVELIENE